LRVTGGAGSQGCQEDSWNERCINGTPLSVVICHSSAAAFNMWRSILCLL